MKPNYTLAELDWELLTPSTIAWDGLSTLLVAIVERQSLVKPYYRTWILAFESPEDISVWSDPQLAVTN